MGRLVVNCSGYHWMTHWDLRIQTSSLTIQLHYHHSVSIIRTSSHKKRGSKVLTNAGRCWGILIGYHTINKAVHCREARTATSSNKNYGLLQPWLLQLHQTVGLRVMEVWCQCPPQYHWGPIDQVAPGISTVADATRSLEVTWKLICPPSRMKTRRMLSPTKVGIGI